MFPKQSANVTQESEKTARQDLSWFDNWSLLFGYSVFAHKRSKITFNWNRFREMVGIIGSLLAIINALSYGTREKFLYSISIIFFYTTNIIYVCFIEIYGKATANYLNDCFKAMSLHHKHRMKKLSQTLSCLLIFSDLYPKGIYLITIGKFSNKSVLGNICSAYILLLGDHILQMSVLIIIMVLSCYYSCINTIDNMRHKLLESKTLKDFSLVLMTSSSNLENLVYRLNCTIGVPLIILLLQVFISIAGAFSFLRQDITELRLWALTELLYVIYYFIFIIILAISGSVVKGKLDRRRKIIIDEVIYQRLTMIKATTDVKIGLQKISSIDLFNFSAFSFLPLDMSLILSFSSSIITFTILFLQLESSG